jgi:hypothetical protein
MPRRTTIDDLARRLDCPREEIPTLMAGLPWRPTTRRRLRAVAYHFERGYTSKKIAGHLGVSDARARQLIRAGVKDLKGVKDGCVGFNARILRIIGVSPGRASLSDVAPALRCRALLSRPGFGRKFLRDLRQAMQRRGLVMGCGCPRDWCGTM